MIYIQLFYEFFKTGLFALGGGLAPLVERIRPKRKVRYLQVSGFRVTLRKNSRLKIFPLFL